MCFCELAVWKAHLSYRSKNEVSHTRCPDMHSICTAKMFKEDSNGCSRNIIITTLGIDESLEWCKSFVLVPKINWKVWLCLDPAGLNQLLIQPAHSGPTATDIFSKLAHANTYYL